MKKTSWIAALLALSLLFGACSASANMNESATSSAAASPQTAASAGFSGMAAKDTAFYADMAEEMEIYEYDAGDSIARTESEIGIDPTPPTEPGDAFDPGAQEQKLVKYVNLSLESKEFDEAVAQIVKMVGDLGGYIENQTVDGSSLYYRDNYYERYAYITARIPSDKLDTATGRVGDLCNVVSHSESVENISNEYYDAQARLEMLQIQEERLLEILKKAEKLEDIITLESALSNVRYQIESYISTMKRMDNRVSYSYLHMDLREVIEYQEVKQPPRTFGDELGEAFARSGRNILGALKGVLFFTIESGPVLILNLAILFVLFLIGRAIWRRVKKIDRFSRFKNKGESQNENNLPGSQNDSGSTPS